MCRKRETLLADIVRTLRRVARESCGRGPVALVLAEPPAFMIAKIDGRRSEVWIHRRPFA
jgi:hypothetical protein